MHSLSIATIIAAAAAVVQAGNKATFKSLDGTARTVKFTPSENHAEIDSVEVAGGGMVTVDIPDKWIGNAFAFDSSKKDSAPGMLAEFCFNGWDQINYFDVSAIIDDKDVDNVSMMYPIDEPDNTSGCTTFPCDNVYVLSDDVQTKTTKSTHIVVTLAKNGGGKQKRGDRLNRTTRSYVLGAY